MRCTCCNRLLNDYEATLKHAETGDYLDICRKCLKDIPEIPYVGRTDLNPFIEDDEDFCEDGCPNYEKDCDPDYWEEERS